MAEWVVFDCHAFAVDAGAMAETRRALDYQGHTVDADSAAMAAWSGRSLSAFAGVFADPKAKVDLGRVRVKTVAVTLGEEPTTAGLVQAIALHAVGTDTVRVRFSPLSAAQGAGPAGPVSEDGTPTQERVENDALLAQVVLTFEVADATSHTVVAVGTPSASTGDEDTGESIRLTRFVVGGKDES